MDECPDSVAGGGGDAVGGELDHKPAPTPSTRSARNKREHRPRPEAHPWSPYREGVPKLPPTTITAPPQGGDKGTQHK